MNARLVALLARRRIPDQQLALLRIAAHGAAESIAHTTPPSSPRRLARSTPGEKLLVAVGWLVVIALLGASFTALLRA